jgi:hypothetical protein
MADKKTVLLAVGSTAAALLCCELALRIFTPFGGRSSPARPEGPAHLDLSRALSYVTRIAAAPGTDRRWFTESPVPLPRAPVDKRAQERFDEYTRRGLSMGVPAQYIFNRNLVEYSGCTTSGPFHNFPERLLTFEPAFRSIHPPYRFPANSTAPDGLVTNQFGFRGPQIDLARPPRTIRVAFAGASTTIATHNFPFSYPEYTVHWLNRFAAASHWDARFEVINAGREGVTSEDIAAIVRYEVAPLDPDLVVYYEGANQFLPHSLLTPAIPRRSSLDPGDVMTGHKVPAWLRILALGELADRVLNGFTPADEPRKPVYRVNWPAQVDERNPDPNSPFLPLGLPRIVRDLDDIRDSLKRTGGELAVSSFVRLAGPGLVLSPTAHHYIYEQLNTLLWPLRYSDIRRLADFQNRVFQDYAERRHIPFFDIAQHMPQNPDFFVDSIHLTDVGVRLQAWVAFQQLAPYIRRQIESGRLPRPRTTAPPIYAPVNIAETALCGAPEGPLRRLTDGFPLKDIAPVPGASLEGSRPAKLVTSSAQWSYAASIPLALPDGAGERIYVKFHARVLKGQVGFGVSDDKREFQGERVLDPAPEMADVYVRILVPGKARELIIRNAAPGGVRSEIIWDEATLVASPAPEARR